VCEDCALRKEIVGEKVDKEDIDVYNLIQTGISTAQAANDPSIIPDDVSKEKMKIYFETAIEKEAHYRNLLAEWWTTTLRKYKITDRTKIDPLNGVFYHCLDNAGNEQIEFVPKQEKQKPKELELVK
jgi:hypothetical protein